MAFELPDRGLVFWPVGNGDSTSIVVDSKTCLQVDLNHLEKSDDDDDASWAVVDELSERVWTPPLMQAVFGRLGACGQVLSCVRPLYAADHTPRARMEMRGSGPNRLRELESSPFGCWFSRPGLVDLCPYLSSVLPTSPTASRLAASQATAGAR